MKIVSGTLANNWATKITTVPLYFKIAFQLYVIQKDSLDTTYAFRGIH